MKLVHYFFLLLWLLLLFTAYYNAGFVARTAVAKSKKDSISSHIKRARPDGVEEGKTAPKQLQPGAGAADEVKVGIYLDRVPTVSIRDSSWTADFYVWFLWSPSPDGGFDPGDFQLVDGSFAETDKEEIYNDVLEDGTGRRYALYRVEAEITKFFNVTRFPRDDHLMTINLENKSRTLDQLVFVPDGLSNISSRVKVPGYHIYQMTASVKPHSYKTSRGDPRLSEDVGSTYSQFVLGVWIKRPDWGFYFKLFQGLYVAVGIALMALLVPPDRVGERFGLAVGALFAAVANNYIVASLLPNTGLLSMADTISGLGLGTIFLTLLVVTIAYVLTLKKERMTLARVFDWISLLVLAVVYVVLNVAIPYSASLTHSDVVKVGGAFKAPSQVVLFPAPDPD